MRLPGDWTGSDLINRLAPFGYLPTRQTGSHVRLSRESSGNQHHITIPLHNPLRVGTLNQILTDISTNLDMSKEELIQALRKGK